MRFRAKIEVVFKDSVLEPKGEAVESAMRGKYMNTTSKNLLKSVKNIRIGNIIHIIIEEKSKKDAIDVAQKVTEDFLCNSIIEKFHIEVEKI